MKRATIILLSIISCLVFCMEARTIKDFFASEQGELLSLLPQNTRLDMIDYFEAGRLVDVKNNLSEGTHFIAMTDNYISVQLTKSSIVELLLVPVSKNDSIIVAITTLSLPAKDSRIAFYNTDWEPIDSKRYFKPVTMKDFVTIPKGDKTKQETVLAAIDFPIISYSVNPADHTIVARHGLEEYMSKEDFTKIKPYLRDSIPYTKKGNALRPLK